MEKLDSLGVVIGRFQIHELHEGHVTLLDYVHERHQQLLILIGHNAIRFNTANPFPFHIRKQMLETRYPRATILPLPDSPISNEHWSAVVDSKVRSASYTGDAILYGSRDSFIPKYCGVFRTELVPEFPNRSGTDVRKMAALECVDDPLFRLGWLAAIHAQYVVTDPNVDVAIHTPDFRQVLMGRRGKGTPLRFFGGFVDKTDRSYEAAAIRERLEEAVGVEVGEPVYLGSERINDTRYGRSEYGIITTFFAMEYKSGDATPGDDMKEGVVEWCDLKELSREKIIPEHQGLFTLLLQFKARKLSR
jgi:bifunctional NMN adenylyltransferase/nudix hydrolase